MVKIIKSFKQSNGNIDTVSQRRNKLRSKLSKFTVSDN